MEKVILDLDLRKGNVESTFRSVDKLAKKSGKNIGRSLSSGLSGFTKSIFNARNAIIGLGSAAAAAFSVTKLVQAANTQEQAIKKLNTALQISGQYTQQASKDLQDYAAALQKTTVYGDETILQAQSLIQSLGGLSKDGLKEATKATTDLASALGIDLMTAATLVGKAAAGEVGTFSRYGLSIKKASTNAETFQRALDAINSKFGGAAQSNVQTFAGSVDQLGNTFGDLMEQLGFLFTKNAQIKSMVKAMNTGFSNMIKYVDANRDALANLVTTGFTAFINGAQYLISGGIEIVKFFTTASAAIDDFTTRLANQELEGRYAKMIQDAMDAGNSALAQKLSEQIEIIRGSNEEQKAVDDENYQERITALNGFADQVKNIMNSVKDSTVIAVTLDEEASAIASKKYSNILVKAAALTVRKQRVINKSFNSIGKAALKGVGKGVAAGFARFGEALVKGGNVLDSFVKAFLGAIAQMAIQQGAAFILEGIGYQFVPGMQGIGAALISAGAALSVFGGALGALTGGGGGAATSSGASSTSGPTQDDLTTAPDTEEIQETKEPQSSVVVNIQGDVLDSDESGLRIVDMINKAVDDQNIKITQRAFA